MLQARKDLANGAEAYLMHYVLKEREHKKIGDISIVREFSEVFSDLLQLPPSRELEFMIYTEPRAISIYKAPHRIAPTELKELKGQLQELLTNGFIKPSISPWGAPILFMIPITH